MNRKSFIKTSVLGGIATGFKTNIFRENKSHILSLSFDDGFKKSFLKIAEIYEDFGLKACLNVIASGHLPEFKQVDDWILPELMGDFNDWNGLKQRGHEIMPHSWKHLNLARQPLEHAEELIVKCLDYFAEHLQGYKAGEAVFNFPFNSSTPELEAFTLSKVRAIRTRGSGFNRIPSGTESALLGCWTNGPGNNDQWVDEKVNALLAEDGGWLILNLHGLDNEGWGPISTVYLKSLLQRLKRVDTLEIIPVGEILKRVAK